ncbi:Gfo/Idh/MocA family protein [Streptomyces sp. NPDC056161]|uniref:Gfo/Idh/MocA family protein n=1 Tax=Streptomyces sp. NPDC056161 TaxID=3345732 RepID=UPI0035D947C2
MRVGMIGSGVQARRRAAALRPQDRLVAVAGPDTASVQDLARPAGAAVRRDWTELLERDAVDAVVVATPPHVHEDSAVAALGHGVHVLCEKPLAPSAAAAGRMMRAAAAHRRTLWCGFNHRFHPAVRALGEAVAAGGHGRALSAIAVYGHAVRPGYHTEWRADPAVVSGGQLMEQGIHLVDLVSTLLWPVRDVFAHLQSSFGLPAGLEDDAHVLLRSEQGQVAFVRSSLSQWRNRFLLEVTLEDATVRVSGLGGSYGDQTLTVEPRSSGPFTARETVFRGPDPTWREEWEAFCRATQERTLRTPDESGPRSLAIVEAAYRSARSGTWADVTTEEQ